MRFFRLLGILFVIIALVLNPFIVEQLFSSDKNIESTQIKVKIFVFQIIVFIGGFFLYYKHEKVKEYLIRMEDILLRSFTVTINFLKRNWKNILLLFLFIPISFLLGEVILRVHYVSTYTGTIEDAYNNPQNPVNGSIVELGEIIRPSHYIKMIYEFKPNLNVQYTGVEVKTNSLGWRESKMKVATDVKSIRILGIGDSVMFGWGVREEERYLDILEKQLNERHPNFKWETIVLAIPGYNLPMEIEMLEKVGLAYQPNMIIYGFVENDHCLPNFVFHKEPFFSLHLFLDDYIKEVMNIDYTHKIFESELLGEKIWDLCTNDDIMKKYPGLTGEKAFNDSLNRLSQIGAELTIPIILLKHNPYIKDFKIPRNMLIVNPIKEQGEYLRINKFKIIEVSDLVISEEDNHPSAKGHKLIADVLYRKLLDDNIIKEIIINHQVDN